jgi:hypothetical protein
MTVQYACGAPCGKAAGARHYSPRFRMTCFTRWKSISKHKQKVVGSLFTLRASTRPSRSPYCSGATPRVHLVTPSSFYIVTTHWKPASTTSLLDLPLVGWETFLMIFWQLPDLGQVGGSSTDSSCLHFEPLELRSRSLILDVVRVGGVLILFLDPRAPYTTLMMSRVRQAST